jgi:hypothetical protein
MGTNQDRRILLRLPEALYRDVFKLAVELSQKTGQLYAPGDVIRAAITYALAHKDEGPGS